MDLEPRDKMAYGMIRTSQRDFNFLADDLQIVMTTIELFYGTDVEVRFPSFPYNFQGGKVKRKTLRTEKSHNPKTDNVTPPLRSGPSLYELEYLNQVASELKLFLESRSVTTMKNIHLAFQGDEYGGQMLLSKRA
jgi:hypothetical protein